VPSAGLTDILFTDVYQPEGISASGDEEAAAARLA
jgi:hypothetical protein